MNKIITTEQAESIANYLLNSNIPSKDAQQLSALLRNLPVMPPKAEPAPAINPDGK